MTETKIVTLPVNEELEAQAAQWLTVMGREVVTDSDYIQLKKWLDQSDRHRTTFEKLNALWDDLVVLKELDDIAESAIATPTPRRIHWQHNPLFAVAASLIVGVLITTMVYFNNLENLNQQANFVTGIGQQQTIRLADGSTLLLNTDSNVQVDFSKDQRNVRLVKGEAHFAVAKNKQRPFRVYAADGVVKAVGTAFTVRLRSTDQVEVTVEEGRVALSTAQPTLNPVTQAISKVGTENNHQKTQTQAAQDPIASPQTLAELTAGQSVIFGTQVKQISQMQTPELNRKLAWRQGMLAYADESLLDVVADVSRYTDIVIEITDPSLRNIPIAGYFRVGEVEALFDSLEVTFGLQIERISDKHVRLSAKI